MADTMSWLIDMMQSQGYRVTQNPAGRWYATKGGLRWDLGPTPSTHGEVLELRRRMLAAGIRLS
jgi:hypothetical protein